jgi:hypothetical protein
MTWFLLSWTGALTFVCYWIYAATKNGSDLDEEQVAHRMRPVA